MDHEALHQFFEALFDPADMVEVRFLPPMKTKANQWWLDAPGLVVGNWDEIADRNEKQDVYFGVNPRAERRGDADAVRLCRCVFVDLDKTTPQDGARRVADAKLPQPSVEVNSGHGYHAYWRLADAVTPQEFRSIQHALARLVGGDPAVKDPPRIMRMPYTTHVTKKTGARCEIVANRQSTHDIETIVMCLPETEQTIEPMPALPEGARGKLPSWANEFLVSGAPEGGRNNQAFSVACAMKGAGWTRADAEQAILAAAGYCVPPMPEDEAMACVESAWGKPRTPCADSVDDGPLLAPCTAWLRHTPTATTQQNPTPTAAVDGEDLVIGEPTKAPRPSDAGEVSNVVQSYDKEGKTILFAQTMQRIVEQIKDASGGWPARAGGMLFVPGAPTPKHELPIAGAVRVLSKHDQLFAWIHTQTDSIFFSEQRNCVDPSDGMMRSPIKRQELYEHLRECVTPCYDATEILPHHPPAEKTWYAPAVLPATRRDVLAEFCDGLNWDTAIDRDLMMAVVLTMFWGGEKGQRPAFVFQSRYGAGSGKTTSATLLSEIAGGCVQMGHAEDVEQFTRRLLSDSGLSRRAVLVDNVKGKMDVAGIEALITAPEISGHRLYHGHATRPNRITWMLTANHPQLSHDLSERSVPINIGPQKADAAFIARMHDFIRERRPELVAAAIRTLQEPDRCEIEPHNRDRWSRWQAAVLQKFDAGNEIAAEIQRRRGEMDSDQDDAAEIAAVARAIIRHEYADPDTDKVFLSHKAMADGVAAMQGEADAMSRRKTISYIKNRLGGGYLSPMRSTKYAGMRGFSWTGAGCLDPDRYAKAIAEYPTDLSQESVLTEMRSLE